jgi:3-oxoacyl-[acyl-carrier protein] reductase
MPMESTRPLEGKITLVTGASRGIGAATAIELARAGAAMVGINYNRSTEAAEKVAAEVRAAGAEAVLVKADVTDREQTQDAIAAFLSHSKDLHVIVNNAGHLIRRVSVDECEPNYLRQLLALNCEGIVWVTQACLPALKRGAPSSVVNVGSIAARNGGGKGRNSILYAAAKAFVHTFTIGLAQEIADAGVRVNCVAPGVIETDFHFDLTGRERLAAIAENTPLGRNGTPEDIARAIRYLATDQSSFLTGVTLDVNGGLLMHW